MNATEYFTACRDTSDNILRHLAHIPSYLVTDMVIRAWEEGRLLSLGWDPEGKLQRSWLNVVEHQVAVARLAYALTMKLCLSEKETEKIVHAALVHDALKRREWETVQAAKLAGEDQAAASRRSEMTSKDFLKILGFDKEIIICAHSTGDIGLEFMCGDGATLGEKIVFYSDCCVDGGRIVGYKQRFDALLTHFNPGGRYEYGNKMFLEKYGKTHRQAYDKIVLPLEEYLARTIRFESSPSELFTIAL